jgi:CBS-domain-containing membrane protein
MGREQIRRMPVCDDRNRLVGIVTLADLADRDPDKKEVTEALADICEPSGMHCRVPVFA